MFYFVYIYLFYLFVYLFILFIYLVLNFLFINYLVFLFNIYLFISFYFIYLLFVKTIKAGITTSNQRLRSKDNYFIHAVYMYLSNTITITEYPFTVY